LARTAFLIFALLLGLSAPAQGAELGLNVNGGAAAGNNRQAFDDLGTLNARWARHFLFWDDFDPANGYALYEAMIAEEERRGVKTLITVTSARGQPPDPAAFARFMGELARRLPGADAFQIWNEADEGIYWRGAPDAPAYVNVLRASYAAIKRNAPAATVVFSPTVGNNYGFLEAAYAAGAQGSFDAMAVHTDTACLDRPPSYFYRERDGRLGRFTFLAYREVHEVMRANGDGDKPIWMTEFGWSAARHRCEVGASAGDKPAGVTERRQARWLLAAMNCLERDPYVTVAMWFTNRDLSGDRKMPNMYGLRRYNGSTRPAFDAFRRWASGGGRSSAACGDFRGPRVDLLAPGDGFVLAPGSNLRIRARSTARDLHRIWFRVEGPGADALFDDDSRPITLLGRRALRARDWGGARRLQNGTHRLIVYATDRRDNAGPPVEITFHKGVAGSARSGSLVRFPRLRLLGRGPVRVLRGGSLPGITVGAVRVEWFHKRGRRWRRLHARAFAARRPFRMAQRLSRPGRWRVRAVYLGRPGIRRAASCWFVFRTTSAGARLRCPRGAVRPGV
jgi:hypothetical protein